MLPDVMSDFKMFQEKIRRKKENCPCFFHRENLLGKELNLSLDLS